VTDGTVIYDNALGIGTGADIVELVGFYNLMINMLTDPNGVLTKIQGNPFMVSKVLHDAMGRVSNDPLEGLMAINGVCKLLPASA
jgi:hypothetical protein